MTGTEALERLLPSYSRYYNVIREGVEPPFVAEARFHSHSEQYVLVRSARISEADSHEYVYFAVLEELDPIQAAALDEAAWTRGTAWVKPHGAHRNSDVTLVVLADRVTAEAAAFIKKSRHYQSYRFGLHGWSNYRAIALETSSGTLTYNRLGGDLKKLFRNIQNQK